jgi:N-acetylmuramoyl-L-alanine amidase
MSRIVPSVRIFCAALVLALLPVAGAAQELSALARLDAAASRIEDRGPDLRIDLALSQPVPWRVRVLDEPARLVLDFREVDFSALAKVPNSSVRTGALRAGVFRAGWSRLVVELTTPMLVETAEMRTGGERTELALSLRPASAAEFARRAALPEPPEWALPAPALLPKAPDPPGVGPLVVVLDPGHGGIDPGAERTTDAGPVTEAALMLTFARELKEKLLREDGFSVVMTREEDVFVPLETRISIARAAGADVFLSLHADSLAEGEAVGASIYTLAADASDEAAAALAERHDRDDLLSGVDLSGQDDLVASVLIDMARTETAPRSAALAAVLEAAITAAGLKMHRQPQQTAGFSVLKSPDIPSLLLEVGFLSSDRDLARISDAEWRGKMQAAIVAALRQWSAEDAARAALREKGAP